MTPFIAFDTETHLITPGRLAPPLVCLTWDSPQQEQPGIVLRDDAVALFEQWLDEGTLLVGHNLPFDLAVMVNAAPHTLPKVFEGFRQRRFADTAVWEQLYDIALGQSYGKRYSLAACAKRRLDVDIEGKTGEDAWRLRYKELDGVPLREWPKAATDYALLDAVYTKSLWQAGALREGIPEDFWRQMKAKWCLHLMSMWGVVTDQKAVALLEKELHDHVDDELAFLETTPLFSVTPERVNRKGVVVPRKVTQNNKETALAVSIAYTGISKGAAEHKGPLTAEGRAILKHLPNRPEVARLVRAWENAGALDRIPRTEKKGIGRAKEVLAGSGNPTLIRLADVSEDRKLLNTYVPLLQQPVINARWNVLVDSGRTSAAQPNLQNIPRRAGVRECFVPRRGWWYCFADYHIAELCSLSQVLLDRYGYSEMAEVIRAGKDIHLDVAAGFAGIGYEAAGERLRGGDKQIKQFRQLAKCFHPDTEVLTRTGWVALPDLPPEVEIATPTVLPKGQVVIHWEVPLRRTQRPFSGELVHLRNEGIDLRVTPDHRMVCWRTSGTVKTVSPEELPVQRAWPNAGVAPGGLYVDPLRLRQAVAVQADGSLRGSTGPRGRGRKIHFGFTKDRKIERFKTLFPDARHGISSRGADVFVVDDPLAADLEALLDEKRFPWWWLDLQPELREVVLEEARFWDSGSERRRKGYTYCSVDQQNADVLQALASITNCKTRKVLHPREAEQHQDAYTVSVKLSNKSRGGNLETARVPYDGDVYCVTTSTDYVLVRDGGVPVITHQCLDFGLPGGMGWKNFFYYACTNLAPAMVALPDGSVGRCPSCYGTGIHGGQPVGDVEIDKACSCIPVDGFSPEYVRDSREAWLDRFPEMRWYFRDIGEECEAGGGEFTATQHRSGRLRGGCNYTAGANTFFQGLTADGAKAAMWLITEECYGRPESPLYGCRPVLFIHDEFGLEVPADYSIARPAAKRLEELMVQGMREFVPDVPCKADAALMERWYKAGEPAYDAEGQLVLWRP